jgi:hypothetical protein
MYRGRFVLGEEVPLGVLCFDGSGTPSAPDAAPMVDVYSGAAKVLSGQPLPALDKFGTTGLFAWPLLLDARFAPGKYTAVYRYLVGGTAGGDEDTFDVLAGGNADGQVLSMFWYPRPQANFIVYQTSDGSIRKGRNPSV